MNFWVGVITSCIFLIVATMFFGTQLFFPYHRIIALILCLFGLIFLIFSLYQKKKWLALGQEVGTSVITSYGLHLAFAAGILIVVSIFLTIFPLVESPFLGLEDDQIEQYLNDDEEILYYLNSRIEGNLVGAIESGYFSIDFEDLSQKDKEGLRNFWINHLELLLELDILKERYKAFYHLSPVDKTKLHTKAFNLGHLTSLMQHYYTLRLSDEIKDHNIKTFLNEEILEQGISKNTYTRLEGIVISPKEIIRINTGRVYQKVISNNLSSGLVVLGDIFITKIDNSVSKRPYLVAKSPLNFLEKNSSRLWYPIQEQAAINISYIKASTRKYHINEEMVSTFSGELEPGDILLQRREWHATNIGIPGFWTHSALYTGSLDFMNTYFDGLEELNGKRFEEYFEENLPGVFAQYQKTDKEGFNHAVIEAKRPGVILSSIEESANADSLSVLRVKNISKSEQLQAVMQSFRYLGRSYDHDFNFVTDNSLVCSELIYKAYQGIESLEIAPNVLSGRLMFTPNDFVQKVDQQIGSEEEDLELILFLDGNEKERTAVEKDIEEFRKTWKRPKWHVLENYID